MGNYVGVDLQNANDRKDMLIAAKNTLENTTNLEELSVMGSLVLEAATPFIQPIRMYPKRFRSLNPSIKGLRQSC